MSREDSSSNQFLRETMLQAEDVFILLHFPALEYPVIIPLNQVYSITKNLTIDQYPGDIPSFQGFTFIAGEIIPVFNGNEFFENMKTHHSWYKEKSGKHLTKNEYIIITTKTSKIGLTGVMIGDNIYEQMILHRLKLQPYVDASVFKEVITYKDQDGNLRITLLLDNESIKQELHSCLTQGFLFRHGEHKRPKPEPVLTLQTETRAHMTSIETGTQLAKNLVRSPKTNINQNIDESFDLLFRVGAYYFSIPLQATYGISRSTKIEPISTTENPLIIGLMNFKNQNIAVLNSLALISNEEKLEDIRSRVIRYPTVIILVDEKIQGYWGLIVDELLPARPRFERHLEAKHVFPFVSIHDNDTLFEALSWKKNDVVFHLRVSSLLQCFIKNEFPVWGSPQVKFKTRRKERTRESSRIEDSLPWIEQELFLWVKIRGKGYFQVGFPLKNIVYLKRNARIHPLPRENKPFQGWVVYNQQIVPIVAYYDVLSLPVEGQEKLHTKTELMALGIYQILMSKDAHVNQYLGILFPSTLRIGINEMTYPLKGVYLPSIIHTDSLKELGITLENEEKEKTSKELIQAIVNKEVIHKRIQEFHDEFVKQVHLTNTERSKALHEDLLPDLVSIEDLKLREEKIALFVFSMSNTLFGFPLSLVSRYLGNKKKFQKFREKDEALKQKSMFPLRKVFGIRQRARTQEQGFIEVTLENKESFIMSVDNGEGVFFFAFEEEQAITKNDINVLCTELLGENMQDKLRKNRKTVETLLKRVLSRKILVPKHYGFYSEKTVYIINHDELLAVSYEQGLLQSPSPPTKTKSSSLPTKEKAKRQDEVDEKW